MNAVQSELEEPPGCGRPLLPGAVVSPVTSGRLTPNRQVRQMQVLYPPGSFVRRRNPPGRPNDHLLMDKLSSILRSTYANNRMKLP
jgi:hypothetical protein